MVRSSIVPGRLFSRVFVALIVSSSSANATSLLLPFGAPVYTETYSGETTYPTTPETDTLSIGGLTSFGIGNAPIPSGPTLDGAAAPVSLTTVGGIELFQGAGIANITPLAIDATLDIAIHVEADSYSGSFPGISGQSVIGAAAFGDTGVGVSANLVDNPLAGVSAFSLVVVEEPFSGTPGIQVLPLPAFAASAVLAGEAFGIDLVLDRAAGVARGAITVAGQEFIAPDLVLEDLGTSSITEFNESALLWNASSEVHSLSFRFTALDVYVIPEPGTGLLVGLGLAMLCLSRRRP